MKKIFVLVLFGFITLGLSAQDSTKEKERPYDKFEDMHRQMMKQFEKMFDNSKGGFSFKFDTTFMNGIDTSFSRSFGFMFDGNNWKSLSPDSLGKGGGSMGDMFKGFGDFDFGKDFDLSDMMKRFEEMVPRGFDMPRIEPYDNAPKQRKGDKDKKEKKYETEKF
jgi:hypothetical protein